jgi:hypothetical protein
MVVRHTVEHQPPLLAMGHAARWLPNMAAMLGEHYRGSGDIGRHDPDYVFQTLLVAHDGTAQRAAGRGDLRGLGHSQPTRAVPN